MRFEPFSGSPSPHRFGMREALELGTTSFTSIRHRRFSEKSGYRVVCHMSSPLRVLYDRGPASSKELLYLESHLLEICLVSGSNRLSASRVCAHNICTAGLMVSVLYTIVH